MVVDSLYYNDAGNSTQDTFSFSPEVIRRALLNIYSQDFHPASDIEQNLFNEIWRTLNLAADRGFSQSDAPDPDDDFRNAIRRSNAVFSAFKVHRLQNDMAQLLLDDDGNLKPFTQWREEAQPIASHQCGAWLRTEYDTAVIRAHQAADWLQFQREKDVLPNLRWVPSTSPNPGKDHRTFWNTILPVDDPFWAQHRPGDRWNCKCSLSATDEPTTDAPKPSKKDRPQPGLDNNPANDRKLFSDTHPYIAHAYAGAQKAVDKLMQQIEANKRIERYKSDEWEHTYVSTQGNGFVVTDKQRIIESQASKAERRKFEKELRMCKTIADNGHEVEYLRSVNRPAGQTYDISLDGIKADLKCITGGAGNIVKYAKKALTEQGAEAVVFEIPSHDAKFYKALTEARRKCEGRIFFYIVDELVLKELKKQGR